MLFKTVILLAIQIALWAIYLEAKRDLYSNMTRSRHVQEMAKEAVKLPSNMALEDVTATLPSNMVEGSASLIMHCNQCHGLDKKGRFCFFHGLKRQRLYTLIKGICKFYPRSQFSISLWDQVNLLDSGDKELIYMYMF